MTDTENPIGERVAAADITRILDGIVRIEGQIARVENAVIGEVASGLETRIAGVDRRLTETKKELKFDIPRVKRARRDEGGVPNSVEILAAAMSGNTRVVYAICVVVIVGTGVLLLKGSPL